MDLITFLQLKDALWQCSQQLNALLGDHPYALGFVPGKSQQWIAELALPFLNRTPDSSFQVHTDSSSMVARGFQSPLQTNTRHFVVFDDAAYSGAQLIAIIEGLKKEVADKYPQEKCRLYLVVPFMSCHAIDLLNSRGKEEWGSQIYNLEVHVVTSGRRIKAITDVLSLAELERLVEIENTMDYFNGRTPNKCLTFMEWKVPDHNSMPRPLKTWFEYSPEQRL